MMGSDEGGRPAEGMPALGRRLRRRARAFAAWDRARSGRRCPPLPAVVGVGCTLLVLDAPAMGSLPAALVREVRARGPALDAPLAFTHAAGDGRMMRGLLLPFADEVDEVVAVEIVADVLQAAPAAVVAGIRPALAGVDDHPAATATQAHPWARAEDGAVALLRPRGDRHIPVSVRLGAARTWAALAIALAGPARARGLRAAIGATYHLLLGLRDAPYTLGEAIAAAFARDPAGTTLDLVFGADDWEGATWARGLIEESVRRHLDADGFVAWLEAAADRAEASSDPVVQLPEALELAPIDRAQLLALATDQPLHSAPPPARRAA